LGKLSWVDAMIITFSIAKIVKGSRRAGKPLLRQFAVCALRGLPPRSAVCRPPSIFVYSFPHSLTVCLLDRLESLSYGSSPSALCGLRSPSIFVPHSLTICLLDRLESLSYGGPPSALRGLRSAVRRPYSFIRSPFVDGLPPRQAGKPLLRQFAVCAPRSAVCRPPSIFVYSFPIR
jgi:hypothetical protein